MMSIKQRKIKIEPEIKLDRNGNIVKTMMSEGNSPQLLPAFSFPALFSSRSERQRVVESIVFFFKMRICRTHELNGE